MNFEIKNIKPVLVIWNDAEASHDDWTAFADVVTDRGLPKIHTIGFLVYSSKELVIIAMSADEKNQRLAQTLKIPRKWIQSLRFLA